MAVSAVKDFANSTTAKLALAAAMAFSGAANAQTVPYTTSCHDGPSVEAALERDGQKPIFIGKRPIPGYPGNVITMNDNGYGYNFERNPKNQELCPVASFKNIQLNYVDNSEIPEWGKAIKPNKGINVQNTYAKGSRLVFIAQTYKKDANGNEVTGKAMTILAIPAEKGAAVWSVDSNALPDSSYEMKDFGIVEKNFNYFMGRGFNSRATSNVQNATVIAMKAPLPTTP